MAELLARAVRDEARADAWTDAGTDAGTTTLIEPAALLAWWRRWLEGAPTARELAPRQGTTPCGAGERHQVLAEWNDVPDVPQPAGCLHELVAAQAARTPGAVALVAPGERLTYGDLDRRAGRLAAHLRRLGVGPEVLCGVLLDRSADLVVALLAILKAGGAYVPLDPAYPASRIAVMLETSRAAVVLTRRAQLAALPAMLPDSTRPVFLDAGWEEALAAAGCGTVPADVVDPANLAYVIFTSGSTGVPKGVALAHRNAAAFLAWAWEVFPAADLAGVLASTSICFDLSVFELFAPLGRGGTVILAENALALGRHPAAGEVTLVNTVPSAMAELLASGAVAPAVRTVNLAGEPLKNVLAQEIYKRTAVHRVLDLYGPSEDTTYSTFAPVRRGAEHPPTIGRPIAGSRVYLLDPGLEPVPIGVPGALYLAGAGLARGYLGRPDATAERFVPDPFAVQPGERLYATGDLARFLPDGELDFLGRIDQQVKVRGFRIEPGEIEAALTRHPAIAAAAVLALADAGGEGKRLVAFVVPAAEDTVALPPPAGLRSFLEERLPVYMVPALFVPLPALPLTPNGKLDRKALACMGDAAAVPSEESFTAPRTAVEATLAAIWAAVFGLPRVGVHDNFFDLGGHSLIAAQVASRVRAALGAEIPLRRLFDAPTVERLARSLEPEMAAAGPAAAILPRAAASGVPLSFAQQRLWFLDQMLPGSPLYNLPYVLRLEGELDAAGLARALAEVVRRHAVLRTTFVSGPAGPVQVIAPPSAPILRRIDLAGLPAGLAHAALGAAARAEASLPFDLGRGPVLRSTLVRCAPRQHALLLTAHHIASDGWSLEVMLDELTALYAAAVAGGPSPLPELPVQYMDFAVWQRGWLAGPRRKELLAWWRERLAGAPTSLDLYADRPRPAAQSFRGHRRTLVVEPELTAALQDLARREEVTPFMLFLTAFAALLARLTRQDDLLLGSPAAGRDRPELEPLIGFFVNTLVLRADLGGEPTFRALLGRMRDAALSAYAHQDLPFDTLVEELRPGRELSRGPLVQAMLAVEGKAPAERAAAGVRFLPLPGFAADTGTAKFDLTLTVTNLGSALRLALEVSADLFDRTTADRLLGHFSRLLAGGAASPQAPAGALPLLSPAERHAVVAEHNDSAAAYPRDLTVDALVAEWAERTPRAVAVEQGERRLTYAGLAARAGELAARLQAAGVGPEVPVAILLERSPEMIVALLAVLAAGGAYVPLDPGHPRERLGFLLADTAAPLVLAQTSLLDRLPEALPATVRQVIRIDAEETIPPSGTAAPPRPAATAGNLAYVLYTSGTTGQPKGVGVAHRAIVRLVRGSGPGRCEPGETFLQAGPIAFDASTFEIWGALANGGRLVLYPGEKPALDELGAVIARHGVTTLWLTAGLFHGMVDGGPGALRPLRRLLAGGDVLSPRHVRAALAALPGCTLVNGYGPTENTTFTCCHAMAGAAAVGDPVPLGRPIANGTVHLLDAALRPVPLGAPGELYAGGDGLARGYVGRPDLTAERFVPDAVSGQPGGRLYATGDLARRRADGTIEFLGRRDQQIKIRGFRIEPAEIEAVLAGHPAVAAAAVVARPEADGDKRLVAWVVARQPAAASPSELRAFLAARLPEAMIPAAFLAVAELPLTANGKVDRRALAATAAAAVRAEGRHALAAGAFAAPRSPEEEMLADLWAEVLRLPRVGVHDNFFALGGHSLLATLVASRVREAFGVELPVQRLFAAPTVAELTAVIAGLAAGGAAAPPVLWEPIRPVPRPPAGGPLTVSFAQRRLWVLERLTPGAATYNIPWPLRLAGPLAPRALAGALALLVERHEILRTTFGEQAGEPCQSVGPAAAVPLPLVDLAGIPGALRAAELARLLAADARRPFDLEAGPLLRAALLRLAGADGGEAEHVLLLALHHIVADGWSMEVLTRELWALYAGALAGPSPLPPLPIQYADFAWWQRHRLAGEPLAGQLAFWRERLAAAPTVLSLPADRPRPAVQTNRGASFRVDLSPQLAASLRGACRREGVTLFMLLLAAFDTYLARATEAEDLLVGTPIANRNRAEIEGLIGCFVNTLVLRADVAGDPPFRSLLRQVRETALAAYAHQDLPFEMLVEDLRPERDLSHTPLFQVMLVLENRPAPPSLPGLSVAPLPVDTRTAKFDLMLVLAEQADREGLATGLALGIEYSTDLFDAPTMGRLIAQLHTLLAAAASDPGVPLRELPLLGAAERAQVLREWNDTANGAEIPEPLACLHELVAAQAARTPDAEALAAPGERLTYRELDRRAGRLAGHLSRQGVGPEVLCGVLLDRSPDLVVALLAILKAGGAYVPLDPAYPAARIAVMLETSRTAVVLTRRELLAGTGVDLPAGTRPVFLDPGWEEALGGAAAAGGEAAPAVVVDPANLAYLIFTSGSTGVPKGVALAHRNAAAFLAWAWDVFPAEDLAGVLASTSVCFDLSVFELFAPLGRGGRVILAENALALARHPAAGEVTLINTVPSAMAELLAGGAVPPSVRTVNLAGEPLKNALAQEIYERTAVRRVFDLYGPSEDTTYSTFAPVRRGGERPPTIGRPIAGTRAYLLAPGLQPVPLGVPGALYLAGDGLARGYLGRPEATAERFLPDPFALRPGERLYATGDLARFRPDGELDFLGRIDQQVKVRGFRIEPGEIEAALGRHPEVAEAAVLALADVGGEGKRLVGFVAPPAGQDAPPPAALRAFLQDRLPHYMVPSLFVILPALPLTPNGKLDRKTLARLGGIGEERPHETFAPPRTPVEEAVAAIWAAVFGLPRVGVHDNFFDLGGHSLVAAQVASRVRTALGIEIPLRRLFEAPTVERLAQSLEPELAAGGAGEASLVARTATATNPANTAPLSFAQQRLWFLDQMTPGSAVYNAPSALRLEGALDEPALERALAGVVRRHEALRTTFASGPEGPVQVIAPARPPTLHRIDLSGLPAGLRGAALDAVAGAEAALPFDLAAGPLLRTTLVRSAAGDGALLLTAHHIVTDGWSADVLLQELVALYGTAATGRPAPLPELAVQYADFALWQRRWLAGARREALLAWWRERLAGAPTGLELPTDRPRPAAQTFRGRRREALLEPALAAALGDLARRAEGSLFMLLLAAFTALLARLTGQDDLLVGSPAASRDRPELEPLIGFFVNTLVLRADLAGEPTFRGLLARMRDTALAAYAHQELPFDTLVEELRPDRDLSRGPLVQAVLAVEGAAPRRPGAAGVRFTPLPAADAGTAKFELTLTVFNTGSTLRLELEHNADLFDRTTADRLLGHLTRLLAAAAADPDREVFALPLLSAAERHALIAEHNDTAAAAQRGATLHEVVAGWAARTPEAVAVEQGERRLTYRELDALASRLAGRLRALGVRPDVPVALLLERSPEVVVAMLAVLRAGGAYVPLDPGHPRDRLGLVLAETGAPVLLAHRSLLDCLPAHAARVVLLDAGWEEGLAGAPPLPPASSAAADSLAYVMFTSGSTGRPKAVGITHRGVVRLACAGGFAAFEPGAGMLQVCAFAFDASTFEIWCALANGGRLVCYPGDRPSPDELRATMERRGTTNVFLTTALFHQMAELQPDAFRSVRQVFTGGEALAAPHARAVLAASPGCTVVNCYGPTESTVMITALRLADPAAVDLPVPLGRPIGDTRIHLLDRRLRPVPLGVSGEVYTGGDGLARGYLGRPDLTANRFVPDPLGSVPGARLYATGDLARRLADGRIEYLGRGDHQVKIRGFRIEPAEIEAVLAAHPGVAQAVVLVLGRGGDRRLVACVVPREPSPISNPPSPAELRAFLKERLPEPMLPAAFVMMAGLPVTVTGKVDRGALSRLADETLRESDGRGAVATDYTAPRTPEEEMLAGLWAEVLRLPRVGVHDNFFELGGHSLLATLVTSRVREAFGVELPVRRLFAAPTVAELVAVIRGLAAAAEMGPRALKEPIRPVPRPDPALPQTVSFAQRRLWFLEQLTPGSAAYTIPWPLRIAGPLDPGALASALSGVVARHEALRTTFGEQEGEPCQWIAPPAPWTLPLVDLAALPGLFDDARESELTRLLAAAAAHPFDLAAGPLLRAVLVRLAGEADGGPQHVLLLVLHHIVADGWSMEVLTRELFALYARAPLPPLPIQYADFAWWQRHRLAGEPLAGQLAFWRQRLAGAPAALALPTDRPRPPVQTTRGASCAIDLPRPLVARLRAACRREGVTLFMLLLAAVDVLLSRVTGDDDIAVGTPIANRNRAEIEGLIGFFVNTLVLRVDLADDPPFRSLLRQVREAALAAYAHQDLPFEMLVEELRPERDLSRSPLFQVMLSLHSRPAEPPQQALRLAVVPLESATSKFDLSFAFTESEEALAGEVEYNRDLFDRATIERLIRNFLLLLGAALESPSRRLSELPEIEPATAPQVLDAAGRRRVSRRELAEIEAVLAAHPGVQEAAAVSWRPASGPGSARVEVFVVPAGAPPDEESLRALAAERLPGPLVPTAFVVLDALPRTEAGDVDRAALILFRQQAAGGERAFVAPRTPLEQAIAEIWQSMLGAERVGATDNFFDLGGHSLLVMRVLSRIRSTLGVDLPAQALFEAPALADFALRVESGIAAGETHSGLASAQAEPRLLPVARGRRLPLSFGQQRLWLLDELAAGEPVLNLPMPQRLAGPLAPPVLAAAITEVVRRHEALRTVFPSREGRPWQEIRPAGPVALPLIDLAGLPPALRGAEAARRAAEDARLPFDLAQGPLLRTALVRLAAEEHLLLLTQHHIVSDGWSGDILVRELLALVAAVAEGRPSPLPELTVQYADFAAWQQRRLNGEALSDLLGIWRDRFGEDLPVLRLPTDRPRPAAPSFHGITIARSLPPGLTTALRSLGARYGATPFMTLLTAFQALLHAYTGQEVIVLGTPVAGRTRSELEGLIGFFVNTVVLRGDLSGDPSYEELLRRTRDVALDAFEIQDLPFEKLVEALERERDRSRSPLFQVMFALNTAPAAVAPLPGALSASPYLAENGTSQFDLTLYIEDRPERLAAELEFSTDLFDAGTMERLLGHYLDLLAKVTQDPALRLSALGVPPLIERAVPSAEPAAAPATEGVAARRARLAARLAHLPAAQREALERRLRGEGDAAG